MSVVLIVDDEYGLAEMAGELLAMTGYTVMTAMNGKLALACVNQVRPDIILLDVMMPIMSGPEMLRVLRGDRLYRDIPVVMMSAAGRESIDPGTSAMIAGFLQKPFTYEELMTAVTRSLASPEGGAGSAAPMR
jgi:CheY-like chemotaxis protein